MEGKLIVFLYKTVLGLGLSDLRVPQYKDKAVLVPDNEPRNKEVIKQIERRLMRIIG